MAGMTGRGFFDCIGRGVTAGLLLDDDEADEVEGPFLFWPLGTGRLGSGGR